MGRKAHAGIEDVRRAMVELSAAGENPTVAKVQAITGGSNRTIAKLMQEVRCNVEVGSDDPYAIPNTRWTGRKPGHEPVEPSSDPEARMWPHVRAMRLCADPDAPSQLTVLLDERKQTPEEIPAVAYPHDLTVDLDAIYRLISHAAWPDHARLIDDVVVASPEIARIQEIVDKVVEILGRLDLTDEKAATEVDRLMPYLGKLANLKLILADLVKFLQPIPELAEKARYLRPAPAKYRLPAPPPKRPSTAI